MPYPRDLRNGLILCSASVLRQHESESIRRGILAGNGSLQESAVAEPAASEQRVYGFVSLADMLNCSTSSICALCSQLQLMHLMRDDVIANGRWNVSGFITDEDKKEIIGWMKIATLVADDYQIQAAKDRIRAIKDKLQKRKQFTQRECGTELRVLLETIEMGLRHQFIYRYPVDKSKVLENWLVDWSACLGAFPSSREDVSSAVDLWAMGHNTASVFHGMRVLEHGLRALAESVGVNFGVENWQNIIEQIEAKIKDASKSLPRGTDKSERLRFLSEAAKEFYYFKDGWRNYVSHNRAKYDEHQARSALEHVRGFMNTISGQISEGMVAQDA